MNSVPHAILVLLNEILLFLLVLHPVLAWDDKVGRDSTLRTGPETRMEQRTNKQVQRALGYQLRNNKTPQHARSTSFANILYDFAFKLLGTSPLADAF